MMVRSLGTPSSLSAGLAPSCSRCSAPRAAPPPLAAYGGGGGRDGLDKVRELLAKEAGEMKKGYAPPTDKVVGSGFINLSYDEEWLGDTLESEELSEEEERIPKPEVGRLDLGPGWVDKGSQGMSPWELLRLAGGFGVVLGSAAALIMSRRGG